ncbi:MAG: hypothetical protein IPG64_23400 [Haliea sp.]|nr:hypothetical protein [Haliea sp.]
MAEKEPEAQKYQLVGQSYFANSQPLLASQYFKKAIEVEQSNQTANDSIVMKSHLVLAAIYAKATSYTDARINAEAALEYLDSHPERKKKPVKATLLVPCKCL